VRILCFVVFGLSLFLPPYIPDSSSAAPLDIDNDSRGYLLAEEGFLMKTSSLTEQGTRSAYSQGIIHTVEAGESIASIARSAFLEPDTIRWANGLSEKSVVKTGDKLLLLPVDGVIHTVKRGQNLQTIGDLYSVQPAVISQQNKIKGGYLLAGQDLIIPGGKPIIAPAPAPVVAITTKPVSLATSVPAKAKPLPPEIKSATITPSYGVFQFPCDCFYTQYYGASHYGIDLQHRGGSPIFAAEPSALQVELPRKDG